MDVYLRPVTPAEYHQWLPVVEAEYASQAASAGDLPIDEARARARAATARLLPEGMGTTGHFIFRAVDADENVGWLWLAALGLPPDPCKAWVYDVSVDEEFRGRGYGRQIMLLAEREARMRGMTSIGLNVFGANMVARALYVSLGYEVTRQQMKKVL
jgi:ribosomal protein S18 acetylase RimI-like enzyme